MSMSETHIIDIHNHFIPPGFVEDARKSPVMDGIRVESSNGTDLC